MTDFRFIVADKLEITSGCQIHVHKRVLLVGNSSLVKFAVEPDKNAMVQALWKRRRGKSNIIGPLAFRAGEWIRQRLKRNERLNTAAAHNHPSAVGCIVGRKAKIRHC